MTRSSGDTRHPLNASQTLESWKNDNEFMPQLKSDIPPLLIYFWKPNETKTS
jgi:hypothetical protein